MSQPSIEEQLKAIESAINLAEARNLPAVIPSSPPPVSMDDEFEDREAAKAREIALSILKKIDEKITDLEQNDQLYQQQQSQTEVVVNEQQQTIELISKELAALKKRASVVEQGLRHIQFKPIMDKFHKDRGEWGKGYQYMWLIVGTLLAVVLLLWRIVA